MTGTYAVAIGLLTGDVCGSNGVCSYQDTVSVLSSYTVGGANGNYPPSANFWPGDIVLMSNPAESSYYNVGSYQGPGAGGGVVVNAAAYDTSHPHLAYLPGSQLNWQNNKNPISPGNVLAIGNNDSSNQLLPGILLPKYVPYGAALNRKGLMNLGTFQDDRGGPTDLITFYDSKYQKTLSSENLRPSWDAGDSALCEDNSSGTDLCIRAGSAWSAYIGNVPDGTSWLQRLTASREILRVPLETGQASNTDNAGQIRLDESGAGSYPFTTSHTEAPICILQDITNVAHTFAMSVSTTSLVISAGTGSDVLNYICWGRN